MLPIRRKTLFNHFLHQLHFEIQIPIIIIRLTFYFKYLSSTFPLLTSASFLLSMQTLNSSGYQTNWILALRRYLTRKPNLISKYRSNCPVIAVIEFGAALQSVGIDNEAESGDRAISMTGSIHHRQRSSIKMSKIYWVRQSID